MNPALERIFDETPEDEPRSRLEPYRELILRWRRQGRTYHRIRQLLGERCQVQVAYATLYEFIQRRSRPRKIEPELEPQPRPAAQPETLISSETVLPVRPLKPRLSLEERIAQRDRIRAAFATPMIPPKEEAKPVFVYDPTRPLTNKPPMEEN